MKKALKVFVIISISFVVFQFINSRILRKIDINPYKNTIRYKFYSKITKNIFNKNCASCHKETSYNNLKFGSSLEEIKEHITLGIPVVGMPAFNKKLSSREINMISKYIVYYRDYIGDKIYLNQELDFNKVISSQKQKFKVDTFFSSKDILIPWSIEFIDENELFVVDRNNGLFLYNKSNNKLTKVNSLPEAACATFGGYLDLELHPNFKNNNTIYLAYSKKINQGLALAVLKIELNNELNKIIKYHDIFVAKPILIGDSEYGSRLLFAKDNYLYITVGHRGKDDMSPQKLDNHLGKVIRIDENGKIPKDNPYINIENALPEIFAIGLRNPQGLAINKEDSTLWTSEHGPKGGDELNNIKKGHNYGWPIVTYGLNYDGTTISTNTKAKGIDDPIRYWTPSIAPCGMDFLNNDKYKEWTNNLFVASLKYDFMLRVSINGNRFSEEEVLLKGIGRMRDIKMGKDGLIYFTIEGLKDYPLREGKPGIIYRLIPVE